MNKFFLVAVFAVAACFALRSDGGNWTSNPTPAPLAAAPIAGQGTDAAFENAYVNRLSNLQLHGEGQVIKLLPDDNEGSRHQRFIVKLDSGRTLLIAHNIDLASRIDTLRTGDTVAFHGEYEWTRKGGVMHWTHRDPLGRHEGGWIKHRGKTYQ